jgi:hypothetical protein
MSRTLNRLPDVFGLAKEKFTVGQLWECLGLSGSPKASCRSPFREEKSPSFSIHKGGQAWTDHGTGEGGDVIDFVKRALNLDHLGARQWFADRLGVSSQSQGFAASKPTTATQPRKAITWPGEIIEGTEATWTGFAKRRGFTFPAVWAMAHAGLLRFTKIDGAKCFLVTDTESRAAEIRRIDGQPFGKSKAYPLSGVDKTWLPGAAMLRGDSPEVAVIVTEGSTDFLTACDLFSQYRRAGGRELWQPVAVLGASCKTLDPECADLIRGRRVRIVPDADEAGDRMLAHWILLFRELGCRVDSVTLPRGTDLTDCRDQLQPADLFSK